MLDIITNKSDMKCLFHKIRNDIEYLQFNVFSSDFHYIAGLQNAIYYCALQGGMHNLFTNLVSIVLI